MASAFPDLNADAQEYVSAKGKVAKNAVREKNTNAVRAAVFAEADREAADEGGSPATGPGSGTVAGGVPNAAGAGTKDGERRDPEPAGLTDAPQDE